MREDEVRFDRAFQEIAESRMLQADVVREALCEALVSAYRKDTNASKAQRIEAEIDPKRGRPTIYVEKEVVDEIVSPHTEVTLEDARFFEPEAQVGDVIMVRVEKTTKNFGRIAAQAAKQVILQRIRQAERENLFQEYDQKTGEIVTATVQSVTPAAITLSLNSRAEAVMPRAQQIPGEKFRPGDKVRVLVSDVKKSSRSPQIVVSRAHRNMLKRLLEYEVPEIYNGQVEIKNIAREAGGRSKVAVVALMDNIDPVGACVGIKGNRIQNIVKELHGEKIDVIEWSSDHEEFIKKALNPAQARAVFLDDDPDSGRTAVVLVPDDHLSQAIGREGQNARLAAKLTHWRIDIKAVSEAVAQALEQIDAGNADLDPVVQRLGATVADVRRIMEKKAANLTVQPEEYSTLARFAEAVETHLLGLRIQSRQARLAEINALRATLPQPAFQIPVEKLDLPEPLLDALAPLENVGEILLRFLIDEKRINRLLSGQPEGSVEMLQVALDKVMDPEALEQLAAAETEAPEMVEAQEAEASAAPVEAAPEAPVAAPVPSPIVAFPDEIPASDRRRVRKEARAEAEPVLEIEEDDDVLPAKGKKGKKGKKKHRQIYFDEDRGEMVVRRQHRGGPGATWDDDFE
ncbi:MAG: transcription termination factor NusA [Chloroflexota bacterium]|nr:transcription termination factor NusA [Chloroflexota bacterium]